MPSCARPNRQGIYHSLKQEKERIGGILDSVNDIQLPDGWVLERKFKNISSVLFCYGPTTERWYAVISRGGQVITSEDLANLSATLEPNSTWRPLTENETAQIRALMPEVYYCFYYRVLEGEHRLHLLTQAKPSLVPSTSPYPLTDLPDYPYEVDGVQEVVVALTALKPTDIGYHQ